jgi:hypothetical protein
MLDILGDESLKDKKGDILQIASTTVRRWLASNRRVLLRNAAPVVLKASLAEPSDTDLGRDVLDVLDYLATNASAEDGSSAMVRKRCASYDDCNTDNF